MRRYFADDERLRQLDQLGEREARPRDRHRPAPRRSGGDRAAPRAASCASRSSMPISCGFSTMPSILIVHGRILQRLRGARDRLGGAELVEIVVVGVDLLVRDRPVEREFLVALGRIEIARSDRAGRRRAARCAARGGRQRDRRRRRRRRGMRGGRRTGVPGWRAAPGVSQPRRWITCMGRSSGVEYVARVTTSANRAHPQVTGAAPARVNCDGQDRRPASHNEVTLG